MKSRSLAAIAATAVLSIFSAAALAQQAPAQPTLEIGSPAPKLEVGKWVKGEPVKELEKGKIYVVEMWATWCGPCRQTIPHLSELQDKYKDVTFIGQDVFEDDESTVQPFVTTMGDRMKYRVALDDKSKIPEGAMARNWMTASGNDGIPTAFIIDKEQRVAWMGHPMGMEPALEAVVKGTYDIEKTKTSIALGKKLQSAMNNRDVDGALKVVDEITANDPSQKDEMAVTRLQLLVIKKDFDGANKLAGGFPEQFKNNPEALAQSAYLLTADPSNPKPDLDLALKLANQANDKLESKNPLVLSVLAAVHDKKGDPAKAVELQKKAIAVSTDDNEKQYLGRALEEYQQHVKDKK